jgi:hypothetical protein
LSQTESRNVVLACRIKASTYNLLHHIAEQTKLKKSMLLRAAITQWLQNAPEDLPLDLKIEITRANMQHIIETIKNLRWTYHQARQAHAYMKGLSQKDALPPHTQAVVETLEQDILNLQNQLDHWLRQQYKKPQQEPKP